MWFYGETEMKWEMQLYLELKFKVDGCVRQIALDYQSHWHPGENIDCKLGF